MWRAFFVAIGIALCIVGGECLIIDKAVLAKTADSESPTGGESIIKSDLEPPEWAPWSMISAGAVVLLYSFTIPRRAAG